VYHSDGSSRQGMSHSLPQRPSATSCGLGAGDRFRLSRQRIPCYILREGVSRPVGLVVPLPAVRSALLRRGRVARLVKAELDPTGKADGRQQAPALVADRPGHLDPLGLKGGHGGGHIVAQQV
jgi:hypothetical protein